ncbi:IS30 family transposase [Streptomyces sp. M2CJ-2]|nr:IS30 family transposase [Streptomyces sp. M2CJ-2]
MDAVSLREWPVEADSRTVPDRWEGDLLPGRSPTRIAAVVERSPRFASPVRCDGRDAAAVTARLSEKPRSPPTTLRKTLTRDRGTELAGHQETTAATGLDVHFADPRSPWQRGTNENPIACPVSTCPKTPAWGACPRTTSTPSRSNRTAVLAERSASTRRPMR